MQMLKLYDISNNYLKVFEMISDDDVDEQMILDTLESIEGDFQKRSLVDSQLFLNLEANADMVKEACKRMQERERSLRKRAEYFKNYVKSEMARCGITEISCSEFCIRLGINPPSVVVDDFEEIPEIYKVANVEWSADKKAIKQAIKDGEQINGVHLERGTRLVIK